MPADMHWPQIRMPCQLKIRRDNGAICSVFLNLQRVAGVERSMSRVTKTVPLASLLMLIGCGKSDPVADEAVDPPNKLAADFSALAIAAPANATTAETARQAVLPSASGGLAWTYRSQDNIALFGPPGVPAFSIQCQKPKEGEPQLIFVRYLPPASGAQGTLSFTGNGQAASVPVAAVATPDGLGGQWRAALPPNDSTRDISEAFSGPGAVEISVAGAAPLVAPSADEPRRVLAACLGG